MSEEIAVQKVVRKHIRETAFCLTKFPHLILPASDSTLESILNALGAKAGVWGAADPFFNYDKTTYIAENDSFLLNDFNLWALSTNQVEALKYGNARCGGSFVMVINPQIPVEALEKMYKMVPELPGLDRFDYAACLNLVCDWIEYLQWAYILLDDDELGHALFITSFKDSQLLLKAKDALNQCEIRYFDCLEEVELI